MYCQVYTNSIKSELNLKNKRRNILRKIIINGKKMYSQLTKIDLPARLDHRGKEAIIRHILYWILDFYQNWNKDNKIIILSMNLQHI